MMRGFCPRGFCPEGAYVLMELCIGMGRYIFLIFGSIFDI